MRFYPKYANFDEITRISVPEEVYSKIKTQNQKQMKRDSLVLYANKFGPKIFPELITEIKKELKNECFLLYNDTKMYVEYDQKFLNTINYENFKKNIIKIYTEYGFVYRRINKILRDKEFKAFWNLKYYYFSLLYSLKKVLSQEATSRYLYRGLNLSSKQQEIYLNLQFNDMLLFNEFMSTTFDKDVALKFAKSLLFEIEVSKEAAKRICEIWSCSVFPHEKEVLLSSGSILKYSGKCEKQENIPTTI